MPLVVILVFNQLYGQTHGKMNEFEVPRSGTRFIKLPMNLHVVPYLHKLCRLHLFQVLNFTTILNLLTNLSSYIENTRNVSK